jgi:flagellar motor switch protein FliG
MPEAQLTQASPEGTRASPRGGGEPMTGIQKAAILMVSLKTDLAAQILTNLDLLAIESISKEIARLNEVTPNQRRSVLEEFYNLNLAQQYVEQGGLEYARTLLEKSLPSDKAATILEAVMQAVMVTPFSFLQKAESENLLTFIQDEHPQTISLILAHLPAQKAAEILSGLPAKKQIDVVKRIATMGHTNPEVVGEVEQGLKKRLASYMTQELQEAGGVESISEILNLADRATERGILESLEEEDPDLVEQIRRLMFVFEDILLVNDKGVQRVLKDASKEDLPLALKTASDELKKKIQKNMSERAWQGVIEEMEYMGPVRVTDVEAAQQRIVDIVRRLEDAGEIVIQGRGGEEEVIV